jgi:hypothetical protein
MISICYIRNAALEYGQIGSESGAESHPAICCDQSLMGLDDFFTDGKSNTGPGIFIFHVQSLEGSENTFGIVFIQTDSVIGEGYFQILVMDIG